MAKSNRVLVVSPDPGLINQVRSSLVSVGVDDVTGAANGEEALELILSESSRLVIAEVDLPGITGQELCRRLKSSGETSAVVALIYRHGDALAEEQCRRVGADITAGRPFQGQDFIEKLQGIINSSSFNEPRREVPEGEVSVEDSVSDESLYSDYEFDAGESAEDMAVLDSLSIRPADTAEMEVVRETGASEEVGRVENPTSRTKSAVRIASLPAAAFDNSFLPQSDGVAEAPEREEASAGDGAGTLREMIAEHLREMTAEGSPFREELRSLVRSLIVDERRRVAGQDPLEAKQDEQ